jgi:hypothetical protein
MALRASGSAVVAFAVRTAIFAALRGAATFFAMTVRHIAALQGASDGHQRDQHCSK